MNRVDVFAFRVSNDERQAITNLASALSRTQSDAVRFVVVEAAKQLTKTNPAPITNPHVEEQPLVAA